MDFFTPLATFFSAGEETTETSIPVDDESQPKQQGGYCIVA